MVAAGLALALPGAAVAAVLLPSDDTGRAQPARVALADPPAGDCAGLANDAGERAQAGGVSRSEVRRRVDQTLLGCQDAARAQMPAPTEAADPVCASNPRSVTAVDELPDSDGKTVLVLLGCSASSFGGLPGFIVSRPADADSDPSSLLQQSVAAWLQGPTAEEAAAGYQGGLGNHGASLLAGTSLRQGVATIEFTAALAQLNNLSTSNVATTLVTQASAAALTVPGVAEVRFSVDGSCAAFWQALEILTPNC